MQLRAILFAAAGSVLALGQVVQQAPVSLSVNADGESNDVPLGLPQRSSQDAKDVKCPKIPMMPRLFYAKRKWHSFLNIVYLTDHSGKEFGYVQSWLIDWKNPFGFPGATFYLKDEPGRPNEGIYAIDPKEGPSGALASPNNAPLAQGINANGTVEQQAIWAANQQQQREHGSKSYDVENTKGGKANFGDVANRVAAYMVGKRDPTGAFSSDMIIKDCKDKDKFTVTGNNIYSSATLSVAGPESEWIADTKDTENTLILEDFSTPRVRLVRVGMKEPCWPFPPFCQQMGMWNWLFHGNEWEGEITQPGYNATLATGAISILESDGAATDMRFLALYSTYQFSNTRWSPLMFFVGWALFFLCCCCTCHCCCVGAGKAEKGAASAFKSSREETEKLMKTMESTDLETGRSKDTSRWACCSRRGGRSVGLAKE